MNYGRHCGPGFRGDESLGNYIQSYPEEEKNDEPPRIFHPGGVCATDRDGCHVPGAETLC